MYFDISNATTISFVFNSETCTNCGKQFKEGYITNGGSPDFDLIYYCVPCAELFDSIDIDVIMEEARADTEHYINVFEQINARYEKDLHDNSSFDWGMLEAGKVSYSDYLRQQCGVYGDEED